MDCLFPAELEQGAEVFFKNEMVLTGNPGIPGFRDKEPYSVPGDNSVVFFLRSPWLHAVTVHRKT